MATAKSEIEFFLSMLLITNLDRKNDFSFSYVQIHDLLNKCEVLLYSIFFLFLAMARELFLMKRSEA